MKARTLCSKGYFPENLPPVYSTEKFGDFIHENNMNNYIGLYNIDYGVTQYNASKRGHNRRIFGTPNPVPFYNISLFIEKNWNAIEDHFKKSNVSLSAPQESNNRAITITPHRNLQRIKITKLFSKKYLITTDISRFYPTIYTHAIPWAIHGKASSKADRGWRSNTNKFNRLDYYCRMSQSGQTIGIPVGPDTSRIIAELISTSIDVSFYNKYPKASMLRHVDDAWISADNEEEAKRILNYYRESVREYELDISEPKTRIELTSTSFEDDWPARIKDKIEKIYGLGFNDAEIDEIIDLVSFVLQYSHKINDEAPIRYAIRNIDKNRKWGNANQWKIFNQFLKTCVLSFSHSIDYVARVIAWKHRIGGLFDKSEWIKICNEVVKEHAPLNNESECLWACWLIMELGGKLRKDRFISISKHCNSFPLIISWYLLKSGKVSGKIDTSEISERFLKDRFTGPNWLFLHEAVVRDWIKENHFDENSDHEFLKRLRDSKVSFFDENAAPLVFTSNFDGESENQDPLYGIEDSIGGYDDDNNEDDGFSDTDFDDIDDEIGF